MERLILREEGAPAVEGRTITLKLCTLGRMYIIGRAGSKVLRERVEPGAFREPLARPRGVLRFRHVGELDGDTDSIDNFHGWMTALREDDGAVYADFEMFQGPREDKILRLAQSGAVTGASMSAVVAASRPMRDSTGDFTSIIRIKHINGASITPTPAYDDAGLVAIREQVPDPAAAEARRAMAEAERAKQAQVRAFLASIG